MENNEQLLLNLLQTTEENLYYVVIEGLQTRLYWDYVSQDFDPEIFDGVCGKSGWVVITWKKNKTIDLYHGNDLSLAIETFIKNEKGK